MNSRPQSSQKWCSISVQPALAFVPAGAFLTIWTPAGLTLHFSHSIEVTFAANEELSRWRWRKRAEEATECRICPGSPQREARRQPAPAIHSALRGAWAFTAGLRPVAPAPAHRQLHSSAPHPC